MSKGRTVAALSAYSRFYRLNFTANGHLCTSGCLYSVFSTEYDYNTPCIEMGCGLFYAHYKNTLPVGFRGIFPISFYSF